MTIAVTGATGQLGRLVVPALIARGARPEDVVAIGRDPEKLAALGDLGVVTRVADYTDPASLEAAFEGVERLLVISSPDMGERLPQHLNVVAAAKVAHVQLIAYTSVVNAATSTLGLAVEHRATEQAIVDSGIPHVLLRNGWYAENYTDQLAVQVQHGTILGAAGDGVISAATRADLAEAAAVALLSADPEAVYELGGPGVTLPQVAEAVTEVTGTSVTYTNLPPEAYGQVLADAGLPAAIVDMLVNSDQGAEKGDLHTTSDALERLLGRPPLTIVEAVRTAAARLESTPTS